MKRYLLHPPPVCGDRYSPVIAAPESLAGFASSKEVLQQVLHLTEQLSADEYTSYVCDFYRQGLDVFGDYWGFMDIVTVLYAIARTGQPANYLEIGVRRGRSAAAVVAASPNTRIFAFDMWQENYAGNENPGPDFVEKELAKFDYKGEITFVNGDSHKTVPEFLKNHPELEFDLITVDGDHSVEGAWDDLCNVVPRLSVGGVVVFDDIANPFCPGLDGVWRDLLAADSGLAGYSYTALGTGVSFAVRMKKEELRKKRRRGFWKG